MFRPAFSAVACPDWTLDQLAPAAAKLGFAGVELRTFGGGSPPIASDPSLTDPAKVRQGFKEAGVELAGIATGVRFDAPIFPPVVGRLMPGVDAGVGEGRRAVELAAQTGARYIRVFPFQAHGHESRRSAVRRICERLSKVVDHARHREVQVVIENGADFAAAEHLLEIIDRVDARELSACYDLKAGVEAGDDPAEAVVLLGSRLAVARVRDIDHAGHPVHLGVGELPCAEFCCALASTTAWAVYTWDALWVEGLESGDQGALSGVVEQMYRWAGRSRGGSAAA